MKKIKNLISIVIGIVLILILGLFLIYSAIINNADKLERFIITEVEKDVSSGERLKVNNLVYASKKLIMNQDLKLEVKHGSLYINGKFKNIDEDDRILSVTGYFYQPGNTYNIYVLTDDNEVYYLKDVYYEEIFEDDFREYEYNDDDLDDVERLVLVDITIEDDYVGQLPERYRVYAKINNRIIHLR